MISPVIGLSTGRMFLEGSNLTGMERVIVNGDYIGAVKKAGGLSVPVPPVCTRTKYASMSNCVMESLLQEASMHSILYGEMPHPGCGIFDLDMDRTHIELIREAIRQGKPFSEFAGGCDSLMWHWAVHCIRIFLPSAPGAAATPIPISVVTPSIRSRWTKALQRTGYTAGLFWMSTASTTNP